MFLPLLIFWGAAAVLVLSVPDPHGDGRQATTVTEFRESRGHGELCINTFALNIAEVQARLTPPGAYSTLATHFHFLLDSYIMFASMFVLFVSTLAFMLSSVKAESHTVSFKNK